MQIRELIVRQLVKKHPVLGFTLGFWGPSILATELASWAGMNDRRALAVGLLTCLMTAMLWIVFFIWPALAGEEKAIIQRAGKWLGRTFNHSIWMKGLYLWAAASKGVDVPRRVLGWRSGAIMRGGPAEGIIVALVVLAALIIASQNPILLLCR